MTRLLGSMFKAVIFDMDGVLVNSEEFYFNRRMSFFEEKGLNPGSTDIHDYLGMSNNQVWAALVPDPEQREVLRKDYLVYQDAHPIDYSRFLNAGVVTLLKSLKTHGMVIGLASAGIYADIFRMLSECHIRPFFDQVLSGEAVPNNKPAPDIYVEISGKLGVEVGQCLAIEDSSIGIQAAKDAGMTTWAVDQAQYNVDQSRADRIVSGMDEIRKTLK